MGFRDCIEGNPFITRFKTHISMENFLSFICIEGNPFITRFKTLVFFSHLQSLSYSIEGNPFITRFKTKRLSILSNISFTSLY